MDNHKENTVTSKDSWVAKSSITQMHIVETIHDICSALAPYELNFKDHYIGLSLNGITQNPIKLRPRQRFTYLECYWIPYSEKLEDDLSLTKLDYKYDPSKSCMKLTLKTENDYQKNKELINKLIVASITNRKHSNG